MEDTKFNPQLWTCFIILSKQVKVKELRIKDLKKSINDLERQIEDIRPKLEDVFQELPPVKLWLESIDGESDWWHISRAITDDFWASASHPKYKDRSDFDYKSENGFDYMRPKVVTEYVTNNIDIINKIIKEVNNV